MIEYDGHYYIFDATMPSEIDREITPIICEIPKEVFEEISSPLHSKGCKVKVTYFNPVIQKQKTIIYDSAAKMSYIVTDDINQKKL